MSGSSLPPRPLCCPGRDSVWQHAKGGFYKVLTVARHSEDPSQWVVVYEPIWSPEADPDAWVRSLILTDDNQWPGFLDVLDKEGAPHRFRHVAGPRTWSEGQQGLTELAALAVLTSRAMKIDEGEQPTDWLGSNPNYQRLLRVIRAATETLFEEEAPTPEGPELERLLDQADAEVTDEEIERLFQV